MNCTENSSEEMQSLSLSPLSLSKQGHQYHHAGGYGEEWKSQNLTQDERRLLRYSYVLECASAVSPTRVGMYEIRIRRTRAIARIFLDFILAIDGSNFARVEMKFEMLIAQSMAQI